MCDPSQFKIYLLTLTSLGPDTLESGISFTMPLLPAKIINKSVGKIST